MVWTASGETWYAKENLPPYLNYTTYVLVKRRPMHVLLINPQDFIFNGVNGEGPCTFSLINPPNFILLSQD